MITTKIRKYKDGFIVVWNWPDLGKKGLTQYLNYKTGTWQESKITPECVYPTRELAQGFLKIRKTSEARWGELQHVALRLNMSSKLDMTEKLIIEECPELVSMYNRKKKLLGCQNE
jgi:hypothetical protein